MENEVKQLAELLSGSASYAVEKYTLWYFVSAVVWSVAWLGAIVITFRTDLNKWFDKDLSLPLKGVAIFLLSLAFVSCLTNVIAPEAYAIHSLIQDIKP